MCCQNEQFLENSVLMKSYDNYWFLKTKQNKKTAEITLKPA